MFLLEVWITLPKSTEETSLDENLREQLFKYLTSVP